MRQKVEEAEAKVEDFRAKANLLVGNNNTTLSAQTLGDANAQLAVARAQKADAEAKAKMIRDMLRSGQPIESSDILNSELIRRLAEQRVTLRAQLAEQSATLLDNHPRIIELKAQIADLDNQIRAEAETIARSFENDAKLASARSIRSPQASISSRTRRQRPTGRTCNCARSSAMPSRSAISWSLISPNIARRLRATAWIRRRPMRG